MRESSAAEIVLFTAGIVLVPPAVLLGVELAVALVSARAAHAVHLVFVARSSP